MSSFAEQIAKDQEEEAAERRAWSAANDHYTGEPCPNCGRNRVYECNNGKHRCEKCNWVVEDQFYCPLSNM